jgi:hypothetical protein
MNHGNESEIATLNIMMINLNFKKIIKYILILLGIYLIGFIGLFIYKGYWHISFGVSDKKVFNLFKESSFINYDTLRTGHRKLRDMNIESIGFQYNGNFMPIMVYEIHDLKDLKVEQIEVFENVENLHNLDFKTGVSLHSNSIVPFTVRYWLNFNNTLQVHFDEYSKIIEQHEGKNYKWIHAKVGTIGMCNNEWEYQVKLKSSVPNYPMYIFMINKNNRFYLVLIESNNQKFEMNPIELFDLE